MNCIQCGAPLRDGAAFCAACGKRQPVHPTAPMPQGRPQPGYPQPGGMEPVLIPPKPKKRKIWIPILAVAAVLAIGGGLLAAYFFLGAGSQSSETGSPGGTTSQDGCATGEEAVEQYLTALKAYDFDALLDCYPDAMLAAVLEEENMTREELVAELESVMGADNWEDFVQTYAGESFGEYKDEVEVNSITFETEIKGSEPAEDASWAGFADAIESAGLTVEDALAYDVGVICYCDLTIDLEDITMTIDLWDKREDTFELEAPWDTRLIALQIDGRWYCVTMAE